MSRRSRRRKKAGGKERSSKWLIALVALILLLMIGVGIGHLMVRRYLHSEKFREFVSAEVSKSIGVEGEFEAFKWDGLAVKTEGFHAEGEGSIRSLDMQGIRTQIGLRKFWDGFWQVKGLRIREVKVEVDARPRPQESRPRPQASAAAKPAAAKPQKSWLPDQVELEAIKVDRFDLAVMTEDGGLSLKEVRLEAQPGAGGQTHELELLGGTLNLPHELAPEIRLERAKLKYQDGAVFVTEAQAKAWRNGHIEMAGEWDPDHDVRSIEGLVEGVECEELLSDDWSRRVRGQLSTDFRMSWLDGNPRASGTLELRNGMLTSLPILDVLGAYLDTSRFRVLTLSEARTDWRWREGQWGVYNLVVASEGLLQLEGDLTVIGERINGNFRLGLAPGTLASIPGAEEHVFLPGERGGLRWTPIRVTGTLSQPRHDLTERLVAAAGRRLLQALPEATLESMLIGKDVVDQSSQRAIREGFRLLDGGAEVIEGGVDVIEEGAGIIQGILGPPAENN
ncbi:MAG: hypothetical protein R3242_04235 [Akkermansiaceae bacterium]|nr:hypothetical protein [Akkermansiaceae bacterium]